MDTYFVEISGENLDMRNLIASLPDLEVDLEYSKGSRFYLEKSVKKPRKRDGVYEDSTVVFLSKFPEMIELLSYLEKNIDHIKRRNSEEIIIWVIMTRGWQINGELSAEEIKTMARIGASYCWSVRVEDEK